MKQREIRREISVLKAKIDKHGIINRDAAEVGRVAQLAIKGGWTIQSIAWGLELHHMRVRRCLTLMAAPKKIQRKVAEDRLSLTAALEIAKLDAKTRAKIGSELYDGISRKKIKELVKAEMKRSGVEGNLSGSKHLKGQERDASLTVRRGLREQNAAMIEAAYLYLTSDDESVCSALKEKLEVFLWGRGDLESWLYDAPKRKFERIVKALAAKYKPDAGGD